MTGSFRRQQVLQCRAMRHVLFCLGMMSCLVVAGCDLLNAQVCDEEVLEADGEGGGAADYLLAAVVPPAAAAAPDAILPFELNLPDDGLLNGLRIASTPRLRRRDARPLHPRWQARLDYEMRRHQGVQRWVERLNHAKAANPTGTKQLSCVPCPSGTMCWQGSCTDAPELHFDAAASTFSTQFLGTVVAGDFEAEVILDAADDTPAARTEVLAVAQAFVDGWEEALFFLGESAHAEVLDRDNDGRITLVFTNRSSAQIPTAIVGFFDFRDFLPAGAVEASGHEADLLWVRLPGTGAVSRTLAVGTLFHEYTHLVSYARRVHERGGAALPESLWLDEALAHLMEDLTGYMPSTVDALQAALDAWPDGAFAGPQDSPAERGRGYSVVRYLVDREARSRCASNAASDTTRAAAQSVVMELIRESAVGYQHARFRALDDEGLWGWLLAVFATGSSDVTFEAAHRRDFLPVSTHPRTGHLTGFNPHGRYSDAAGQTVQLSGPAREIQFADEGTIESEVFDAGSIFFTVDAYNARLATIVPDDPGLSRLQLHRQRIR